MAPPVLATTVVNDGNNVAIHSGVITLDQFGNGTTGPFAFANVLLDSATGTTFATIKKANTTAVAADTGLVVSINPTSNAVVASGTVTAVVSGTTFISGGNLTAVVSGTAFISGGNLTAVVSGTTFVSGGNLTAVVSGTAFVSGGTMTAIVTGSTRAARNYVGTSIPLGNFTALAANQAVQYLFLQNTHTGANIAVAFATPAILNSTASLMLGPGQSISWGPNTFGVPSGALNAIASQTAPLYIEWI